MATMKTNKAKHAQTQVLEDFETDDWLPATPQTLSPSYRPAYKDKDFLLRDELRPARLQMELIRPELLQQETGIESTIVVFEFLSRCRPRRI